MYDMWKPLSGNLKETGHYYAFYLGSALIISFSTELHFFDQYFDQTHQRAQKEWLEALLKNANKEKERKKHPWIIMFAHRPMYCSNKHKKDRCRKDTKKLRKALEYLLRKYGVDLAIWAHEHSYERFFPVYNGKTANGSDSEQYKNPKATVHLVNGAAPPINGCSRSTSPRLPGCPLSTSPARPPHRDRRIWPPRSRWMVRRSYGCSTIWRRRA